MTAHRIAERLAAKHGPSVALAKVKDRKARALDRFLSGAPPHRRHETRWLAWRAVAAALGRMA